MDIDKMEAGREMDALVAERVMGWKNVALGRNDYGGEPVPPIYNPRLEFNEEKVIWMPIPAYSTDIAAAWLVEERIAELGLEPEYSEALLDLTDASEHFELIHAKPADRCRAALKAMESE